MKSITLEMCVCPRCVMNGAMELMDGILSIRKMKNVKNKLDLKISTTPNLSSGDHHGPAVVLNGECLENVRENELMSKILNLILTEE